MMDSDFKGTPCELVSGMTPEYIKANESKVKTAATK